MASARLRAFADRFAPIAPYVVLAATFVHGLYFSWLCWGDLITDSGRELEVARQIADGQVLYVDVFWFYGPLAPYVNGALYALLGAHAEVLMAAGAVSAATMTLLLYALARCFVDRLPAATVAAAFVYLCAFGHYYFNSIFNWVLPYAYSATYGMLAATASLYLLIRHVQRGEGRALHGSVACLVLAALTKPEALLPATVAHLVFLAVARPRLRPYLIAAAVTLGVYGMFWLQLGGRLLDDYVRLATATGKNPISRRHMGLTDWSEAIGPLLQSGGALAVALALTWGASVLARAAWLPIAAVLAFAGVALVYSRVALFDQLRVLPFVLAALLSVWLTRGRLAAGRQIALPRLLLLAFSLACLVRLPFTTGAYHYGFYMLPVPLVAFAVSWFRDLPEWLPGRPVAVVTAAGLGLFAALMVTHYRGSNTLYAHHTVYVESPRGRMYLLADLRGFPIGEGYAQAVQHLAQRPPSTRVLVVPQGVGLTFLGGLTSVCGMTSFTPPEMVDPFEDRLLTCLEAAPPDLVVHVGVNLEEYGVRTFGKDYAQKVGAWIASHYEPAASFGPGNYVSVLRRIE